MICRIKIENNSNQILEYLEILGYTWQTGDKPTEWSPSVYHNCFSVYSEDRTIGYSIEDATMSFEEFKRQNPIKKEHIRSGMVVEYRNGQRRLVVDFMGELMLISNEGCHTLATYKEDLTYLPYGLCIDKVLFVKFGHLAYMLSKNNPCVQIWERPNPVIEVTLDEIAEKFGIDIKQLKIKK